MPGRERFDIAVVGAGAAGCLVAARLAASGERSIILLEAGPDLRDRTPDALRDGWILPTAREFASLDWGLETEPDANGATQKLRRGRLVGGTSWLTRFAVRGAAADFDGWATHGTAGWRYDDVLPWFRRLEADAEFGDRPWHGAHGPMPVSRYPDLRRTQIHEAAIGVLEALGFPRVVDHNAPTAIGVGPMPMSTLNGQRITSADAYLAGDRSLPGLEVRAEAPVAKVIIHRGRVTGLLLADGSSIEAGLVVLSAGVYGSPTILMRSGIGPAGELGNLGVEVHADLPGVGSNLADHPGVDLDSGWRGTGVTGPSLHSIATFRSTLAPAEGPPDLMFWLTDPSGAEPAFYLDPVLLKPASRGTVRLRSSAPLDPPRITLPGLREDHDVDRLAEGYQLALEVANRPEIQAMATVSPPATPKTRAELRQRILDNAYSLPHVIGTCAMGASPDEGSVVDGHGRVHGVDGLAVIDASIIPEATAGFPHLVTLMLAMRLSDELAATCTRRGESLGR